MRLPLLLTMTCLALTAGAQTFPIAGVIVNAESGAPMLRARLILGATQVIPESSVVTGADGRFFFEVPKGEYHLTADYQGVRQVYGLQGPALGWGVGVDTGPKLDTGHLTFHWYPPGAITGTVIDDRGEPVESATVQLIRSSVSEGRKRIATASMDRTDDRGIYRFAPLVAGTYYVYVTAEPWYVALSALPLPPRAPGQTEQPSEPTAAYAPVYYPAATDLGAATPLALSAGAELHADFTLRTITGVNVNVNCATCDRQGLLSLISINAEGPHSFQRQINFFGATPSIPAVPPGHYIVRLTGAGENPFAVRKIIDVASADVTVDMTLQPPPSITGRVTFANPAAAPKSRMYVNLVNETDGGSIGASLQPDGTFTFRNLPVAQMRPRIAGAEGFYIAQFRADGASVKDGLIGVEDGAAITLNLIASDDGGIVHGFVMDGDKPVPGALVVLAPRKESADAGDYRGYQADGDGSFGWENIPPGDYLLFASAQLDLEYATPLAVKPYLAAATPVRVQPKGTSVENIAVSTPTPGN